MKKTSVNPLLRAGKAILAIIALPFMLLGILIWSIVTLGKVAVETIVKKKPAAKLN